MTLLHQAAQKAVEVLTEARDRIACSVCYHDETQRRGFIWTECLQCGAMFADDKGGVPAPKEPKELAQIDAAIAQLSAALQQQPEPVAFYCDKRDLHHQQKCQQQCAMCADCQGNTAPPALQHQEVPREPVAVWQSQCKDGTWADCTEANARAGERYGFAARALYASPSTTRQQEVGSGSAGGAMFKAEHEFLEWNRAQPAPLVKVAYEYGVFRKAVDLYLAAAPSTPEKAGGVSDGVGGNDGR